MPYRLLCRRPWVSAHGARTERRGWWLRLETSDGLIGNGDCAPLPEAGTETGTAAAQAIDRLCATEPLDAARLFEQLDDWRATPALRCALETALLDLNAQRAALPLARWLNPEAPAGVAVNASLGALDGTVAGRAQAAIAAGFRVLKLKVGLGPAADEAAALRVLAQDLPSGVLFRLDANGAWDEAAATAFLDRVRELPVDCLEEPLRDYGPAALARLQARVPWPLALDESMAAWFRNVPPAPPLETGGAVSLTPPFGKGGQGGICPSSETPPLSDPASGFGKSPLSPLFQKGEQEAALEKPVAVLRLVLKPTVLGGLLPAMELARLARAAGMQCVVTSSLESAPGLWAAAHLAAAIDTGLAHGLATAGLMQGDMLRAAPRPVAGWLNLPERPGLGWEG